MYIRVLQLILAFALAVMLVAPFTFMKPLYKVQQSGEAEAEISMAGKEKPAKKPPVKRVAPERPLHSVKLPDFASIMDVAHKKKLFFSFIAPAIINENKLLMKQRKELVLLKQSLQQHGSLQPAQLRLLNKLSGSYDVSGQLDTSAQIEELLLRVDEIPSELVLVQAANESAWGTSRFARIGLNFFGIWCYRPQCGMVPKGRVDGAIHEVAKFNSVDANVRHYFRNINTHNSYQVFRLIRAQLRQEQHYLDPQILASGLLKYSQRGGDYVIEITNMIRHNQSYFTELLNEKT
jgi:Bax protein